MVKIKRKWIALFGAIITLGSFIVLAITKIDFLSFPLAAGLIIFFFSLEREPSGNQMSKQ